MRKGIATETIFYIVIGIVVVGLLTTLVISYTGTARESSDCKVAQQQYCEAWELSGLDENKDDSTPPLWSTYQKKCSGGAPKAPACERLGYNIADAP